ncbi:MAG: DNA ligase D [Solirubrobacteraceae bacterium]
MRRVPMPARLRPMLARPGNLPDDEQAWAFEVKWDGVRAIAYCSDGRLRLESRNLNDVTSRYPELRPLAEQLAEREAVLDGEIVAFDEHGTPSFARLQRRMHLGSHSSIRRLAREQPVTYVIFDLLHLDGHDVMRLPYLERRELLEQLSLRGETWQTPAHHRGKGSDLLAVTGEHRLEGVLAKRLDSAYRPGERSANWVKVKNVSRQELVVGGWLPGKGRRSGELGALLLGYYERENGSRRLRYAGRVGTGFDEAELRRLGDELRLRACKSSPFSSQGTQPPREARFVKPQLVAEVEFTAWTNDGVLRHPSYKGQRYDKPAEDVRRESIDSTEGETRNTSQKSLPRARARTRARVSRSRATQHVPYEVVHETKHHADIQVDGRTLRLSNREKVLYPRAGFTKGRLIDYYAAVAPALLPHLRGRPLTLKRYPDGVDGEFFYEKHCPAHRPDWVHTVAIWSERNKREVPYCVVEDLPTLIWTANLASVELHTSLSLARHVERPRMVVFDLDPGAPAGLKECCRVALRIRELFDAFGIHTLAKTSGSKGLQVYVPLNSPTAYEHTKPFARAVAELLAKQHPKQIVSRMSKSVRRGKVFIDWSQNDEHKTTVCVYSLRATERPLVSTPLRWEEVERGSRARRALQLSAEPDGLLKRLEREGDLFAPLLTLEQRLPDLSGA